MAYRYAYVSRLHLSLITCLVVVRAQADRYSNADDLTVEVQDHRAHVREHAVSEVVPAAAVAHQRTAALHAARVAGIAHGSAHASDDSGALALSFASKEGSPHQAYTPEVATLSRALRVAKIATGGGLLQTTASLGARHIANLEREVVMAPHGQAHSQPAKPKRMKMQTAIIFAVVSVLCWTVLAVLVGSFYADPTRIPVGEIKPALAATADGLQNGEHPPAEQQLVQPAQSQEHQQRFDDWSSGTCGCFSDAETCLCSFCCPVVRWSFTVSLVPGLLAFWAAFGIVWLLNTPDAVINEADAQLFGNYIEREAWEAHHAHKTMDFAKAAGGFEGIIAQNPWVSSVQTTCFVAVILVSMMYRQKIRKIFGMPHGGATIITDVLLYTCCSCCTIAQEARHVQAARRAGHPALDHSAAAV